jgi:2-hydroxy-3-keto-5-methylthiopentenyl-1-phosphate phosphatase
VDPANSIPSPRHAQVWIDFDGTITQRDVLDDLILAFAADDSWKEVERQWQAGEIGSRQCLEFEFGVLRVADDELDQFLNRVNVDPGIKPLLTLLDRFDVPRAILSDGIDRFIHQTLARQGIENLPVHSNTIARDGDRMKLLCPLSRPDCESAAAHCKCGSIQRGSQPQRQSIYIGDGRSDLCPARKCAVVFAKGALADNLTRERRKFIPFTTLSEVADILSRAWETAHVR